MFHISLVRGRNDEGGMDGGEGGRGWGVGVGGVGVKKQKALSL